MTVFFDVCRFVPERAKEMIEMYRKLGFGGAYFLVQFSDKKKTSENLEELKEIRADDFSIKSGLLIETDKPGNIRKALSSYRNNVDMIMVKGLNEEVLRKASQTSGVDAITGLVDKSNILIANHITLNFCKENNIAVDFPFYDVLSREGVSRANFLSSVIMAAKLASKKNQLRVTSHASNEWDLRAPSELISYGRAIGLPSEKIKAGFG